MALETYNTDLDMYADDSTLGGAGKTMAIVEYKLDTDAESINKWCDRNKMAKNTEKTKSMLITTYQKYYKLPVKELTVTLGNLTLQKVKSEKLLGVTIDQTLSWKPHIDRVHKTVSMCLAKFRQIKPFLPTTARIRYCQAFILPHLDYCSCVWGSGQVQKLYKLQKRAARMIFDLPTQTPTKPLFQKLKWMTIMDRTKYRKSLMVYKSLNGLAPQYMKDMYKFVSDVNTRDSTRLSDDKLQLYLVPKNNLKVYTDCFMYSSALIWNKLPYEIRSSNTVGQFKGAYSRWFFSQD